MWLCPYCALQSKRSKGQYWFPICIRLRPKWDSMLPKGNIVMLPKGNIVIMPKGCIPIRSFNTQFPIRMSSWRTWPRLWCFFVITCFNISVHANIWRRKSPRQLHQYKIVWPPLLSQLPGTMPHIAGLHSGERGVNCGLLIIHPKSKKVCFSVSKGCVKWVFMLRIYYIYVVYIYIYIYIYVQMFLSKN